MKPRPSSLPNNPGRRLCHNLRLRRRAIIIQSLPVRRGSRRSCSICATLFAVVVPLSTIAGCMVGPNYLTPKEKIPDGFQAISSTHSTGSDQASSAPVDLTYWWKSLNDPVLDSLIDQALASNLDLAIATARVEEARIEADVVASALWPMVGVSSRFPDYRHVSAAVERAHIESRPRGSLYTRQSVDKNGLSGPTSLYLTTPGHHPANYLLTPSGTPGDPNVTTNVRSPIISADPKQRLVGRNEFVYQAGFDVAWELDVFGGVQRAMEAAHADVEAQAEVRNAVMVVLLADVARSYIDLKGFEQRSDIAARNIEGQQITVNLVHTRFRNGLTSDLDVALAERQLQTTQSRVPLLKSGVEEAKHRLALLLDLPMDQLDQKLATRSAPTPLPPNVPSGLPSDLLRNRPDIRRAERELASATARIGVATAELFPRFTLTGSFGVQTSDVSRLLDGDALTWSAGPGFRWPIFDAGRIIGNIHVREIRAQEALLDYRRVLLTAIKEVQDALVIYNGQMERLKRLRQAVDSSERAVRIAKGRYEKGLTDFLNVLDAERALYDLEDQAAASEQDASAQLISLYKALGRGWNPLAIVENGS